jgi:hypothetical protein
MRKRQMTMAKMAREREVKERRERKLEKKRAAAAARKAGLDGTPVEGDEPFSNDTEPSLEPPSSRAEA